jgi:hypothetical protein
VRERFDDREQQLRQRQAAESARLERRQERLEQRMQQQPEPRSGNSRPGGGCNERRRQRGGC